MCQHPLLELKKKGKKWAGVELRYKKAQIWSHSLWSVVFIRCELP